MLNKNRLSRSDIRHSRIAVITSIDGVVFETAYPIRNVVEVDGMQVSFIGLEELKIKKRASGRGKLEKELSVVLATKPNATHHTKTTVNAF